MQVHIGQEFRTWMAKEYPNILLLFVPPNCTGKLQPQDVCVQRPFKAGLAAAFKKYQVTQFLLAEKEPDTVAGREAKVALTDFRMSRIKPLTPAWIYAGWLSVAQRPEMVREGWRKCMLGDAWEGNSQDEAVKAMSDPAHHLFPLFPKGDPSSLPEEVDGGVGEPEQEAIRATAVDFELDSNEEAHIQSCVILSSVVPEQAEQLPVEPTPADARKRASTSDFMLAFRQPQKTMKKGKR